MSAVRILPFRKEGQKAYWTVCLQSKLDKWQYWLHAEFERVIKRFLARIKELPVLLIVGTNIIWLMNFMHDTYNNFLYCNLFWFYYAALQIRTAFLLYSFTFNLINYETIIQKNINHQCTINNIYLKRT